MYFKNAPDISCSPVYSTNKTDHHDITEILLKRIYRSGSRGATRKPWLKECSIQSRLHPIQLNLILKYIWIL
jgi:hypothetical protein